MITVEITGQKENRKVEFSTRKEAFALAWANAANLQFSQDQRGGGQDCFVQRMEKKTVRVIPNSTDQVLSLAMKVAGKSEEVVKKAIRVLVEAAGGSLEELDRAEAVWAGRHRDVGWAVLKDFPKQIQRAVYKYRATPLDTALSPYDNLWSAITAYLCDGNRWDDGRFGHPDCQHSLRGGTTSERHDEFARILETFL